MGIVSKLVLIIAGLFAQPERAIEIAVQLEDAPEYEKELKSISRRESRHQDVSIHKIDHWASKKAWNRGVRNGWLDLECPFHADPEAGWSSRGNFGLFSAYHLRYLEITCLPPSVLDNPFVSAVISIRKMRYVCEAYGACNRRERRWVWSGLSVYYRNKYGRDL